MNYINCMDALILLNQLKYHGQDGLDMWRLDKEEVIERIMECRLEAGRRVERRKFSEKDE